MPSAGDGWNRSLYSFFSLRLSRSPSLFHFSFVSVSPLSMHASPLLVLKKLWHVRVYDEETEEKERPTTTITTTILCSRNDFLALFLVALQGQSPRHTYTELILRILTRCACPSSVRMYIYTRMLLGVSHFTVLNMFIVVQYSCFFKYTSFHSMCHYWNSKKKRKKISKKKMNPNRI